MEERDDGALMAAAARGDRQAFGVLTSRHHRTVLRFVHRFLGIAENGVAEDVTQDVFLAAWRSAPSFRGRAKVTTWLLRTATNACLNYRRGERLRSTLSLGTDDIADIPTNDCDRPDVTSMAHERTDAVKRAMTLLPDNQCAAILLRHFAGHSYVEIAEVLDTSVSAVESLLFRARRTLHEKLVKNS